MPNSEPQEPNERDVARAQRAKTQISDELFKIPGVHSVGVGFKRVTGKVTSVVSVVVFVDEKLPKKKVRPEWKIPAEVKPRGESKAVKTDVVQRPRAVEYDHLPDGSLEGRVRPVPGGRSIQGSNGGGTLGGWVWDVPNDQPVLLSNTHVLGNAAVPRDVYQPWGSVAAADNIAENVRNGTYDATIAVPTNDSIYSYEIEGIGPAVYETAAPTLGMKVEKSGATTEHTTGVIVTIDIDLGHFASNADFEMLPDPSSPRMAYFGDSGSLIVERVHPQDRAWKRVVGLLWGGVPSQFNAYAHPIEDVFEDLNLTTLCSGLIARVLDSLVVLRSEERSFGEALLEPYPLQSPSSARPSIRLERSVREPVLAASRSAVSGRLRAGGLSDLESEPGRHLSHPLGRRAVPIPSRGLARRVEGVLKESPQGAQLAALVQTNRVVIARSLMKAENRRVLHEAAGQFLGDSWSATEVLERRVTSADVKRFRRAVEHFRQDKDMTELVKQAESLLDGLEGKSLRQALKKAKFRRS